jgi:anhydro-N-acetylmuramic acid kinase
MEKPKVHTVIGLMSGTSLDGVDCALLETDGADFVAPKGFLSVPYTDSERAVIRAAFGQKDRSEAVVKAAEAIVTDAHIAAVKQMGAKADLIGFHGQTIYHAPKDGITIQIGDGARMANELGMDVVDDFRSNDVKQGGEGAPLAPLYHAARIKSGAVKLPAVILNIGGVANVTYIDAENILAFDCGPGNALMDDWVLKRTGRRYDEDGKLAAQGKPLDDCLEAWLSHPYFSRVPPKSLDRDQWDIAALGELARDMDGVSDADGAATLLSFTIETIARAVEHMPHEPKGWYACGGGRHNKALMKQLNERLGGSVHSVDDIGWDGDATEAECFGYLAVRSLLGLPISLPTTTGVPLPVTGGTLHRAS